MLYNFGNNLQRLHTKGSEVKSENLKNAICNNFDEKLLERKCQDCWILQCQHQFL